MRSLFTPVFFGLLTLPVIAFGQGNAEQQDPFQHPFANPVDKPDLPRVLIVGDSISIGYTPRVRRLLDGKANVHRPKTNCRWSAYGDEHIKEWIGDSKWDVIHFNFGLWDWYGWSQDPKATPESYAGSLDGIVRQLKPTGARLIFAMTTPPCIGPERKVKIVITEARAKEFNDAALAVMKKHGVGINDLYSTIGNQRAKYQRNENDVHYTEEGRDVLAAQVAQAIGAALPKKEAAGRTSPPVVSLSKPNIVFILADDMGYGDVSSYNPKGRIRTPNIDRLAKEGVRFTDAHSGGSSCIPSRYALMTGRFAVRHSMALNQGPLIEAGRMTVPSMLRDHGYATAMVGKWHLGFDPFLQNKKAPADYSKPLKGGPVDCGFDSFFGMHASLDLPPYFYIRDRRPVLPPTKDTVANDSMNGPEGWNNIQGAFWRAGKISPDLEFDRVTPRFFDEAVNVIRRHAGKEKPLFLYLALPSPHTPWLPLKRFRGMSGAGMYGDFVLQVDAGVGRVLKALKTKGIDQDTLIVFSSDNGPVWYEKDIEKFGHDAVGGLRGMKFSSWEGGHRMPFLARWPRRVPGGRTCDQTVVFSDMLATLAEIVGRKKIPDDMAEDSVSFRSHLLNPSQPAVRRPPIIHDRWTIRVGDWKLILPKQGRRARKNAAPELYNLKSDRSEQNNLIAERPEIVQRLKEALTSF